MSRHVHPIIDGKKQCKNCNVFKPIEDFNKINNLYTSSRCRICYNLHQNRHYDKTHPASNDKRGRKRLLSNKNILSDQEVASIAPIFDNSKSNKIESIVTDLRICKDCHKKKPHLEFHGHTLHCKDCLKIQYRLKYPPKLNYTKQHSDLLEFFEASPSCKNMIIASFIILLKSGNKISQVTYREMVSYITQNYNIQWPSNV